MAIRIMTDSGSDITKEELEQWNVTLLPMNIICGEDSYIDNRDRDPNFFWELLIAGQTIKTSLPSPEDFVKEYEKAKEAGDEVIYITLAGSLSGTYQTALLAREIAEYDKVYVIDSCKASVAQKMIVYEACRLRDGGELSAAEIADVLLAFRSRIRLFACLNTLDYLAKGGRISKTVASIGNLARLKPIITFTESGSVSLDKKSLGAARAMRDMTCYLVDHPADPSYPIWPIFSYDNTNCSQFVEKLNKIGIYEGNDMTGIGVTIGAYIGPGAYGIVYVENEE